MKHFILASILLGASCVAAMAQSVGGTYTVQGINLDGSTYGGTATIEGVTDTTCTIIWSTGGTSSEGVCMRYGPAFSAFFVMDADTFGLAIYEIKSNGVLDGIWTITGREGSGTEILSPQ